MCIHFLKLSGPYLKTGLGGRLDATNVINPELSIITSISLDHTQILGASVEAIAKEKAGILKPGVPLVTLGDRASYPVIQTAAKKRSVPLHVLFDRDIQYGGGRDDQVSVTIQGRKIQARCPLRGRHQMENLALALSAFHHLTGITGDVSQRLNALHWPARMETLATAPPVILDGAHNVSGVQGFMDSLDEVKGNDLLVFGCMKDKQSVPMYQALQSPFPADRSGLRRISSIHGPEDYAGNPGFYGPICCAGGTGIRNTRIRPYICLRLAATWWVT